jgi:hypothetical protein
MLSDILSNLIETGTYSIPGFEPHVVEPVSVQKRPELDDSTFEISKPRYSSNELAIMESELTRAQALFSLGPGLKKALQDTVDTFNKAHNPSGIPWKEQKRPNEDTVASLESGSRGVFLPPCSKTLQELESEGAYVFVSVSNPRVNMNFKVIMAKDGSNLYLICE